jgi:hypothetical protein
VLAVLFHEFDNLLNVGQMKLPFILLIFLIELVSLAGGEMVFDRSEFLLLAEANIQLHIVELDLILCGKVGLVFIDTQSD